MELQGKNIENQISTITEKNVRNVFSTAFKNLENLDRIKNDLNNIRKQIEERAERGDHTTQHLTTPFFNKIQDFHTASKIFKNNFQKAAQYRQGYKYLIEDITAYGRSVFQDIPLVINPTINNEASIFTIFEDSLDNLLHGDLNTYENLCSAFYLWISADLWEAGLFSQTSLIDLENKSFNNKFSKSSISKDFASSFSFFINNFFASIIDGDHIFNPASIKLLKGVLRENNKEIDPTMSYWITTLANKNPYYMTSFINKIIELSTDKNIDTQNQIIYANFADAMLNNAGLNSLFILNSEDFINELLTDFDSFSKTIFKKDNKIYLTLNKGQKFIDKEEEGSKSVMLFDFHNLAIIEFEVNDEDISVTDTSFIEDFLDDEQKQLIVDILLQTRAEEEDANKSQNTPYIVKSKDKKAPSEPQSLPSRWIENAMKSTVKRTLIDSNSEIIRYNDILDTDNKVNTGALQNLLNSFRASKLGVNISHEFVYSGCFLKKVAGTSELYEIRPKGRKDQRRIICRPKYSEENGIQLEIIGAFESHDKTARFIDNNRKK